MKEKIIFPVILILALSLTFQPVHAEGSVADLEMPQPLCLPNVFQDFPESCQTLGPAQYLSRMADKGITLPMPRLPAWPLSSDWSALPYYYVKGIDAPIPIYSSLQDAIAKTNAYNQIKQGFVYFSYVDITSMGSGKFFMIDPGQYIRGGDTAGRIATSDFVGLQFAGTPTREFGWILLTVESQREPGFSEPRLTGHTLYRYDLIQVFDTVEMDGVNWYLIGPDEWIEGRRYAALVYPTVSPPGGVTNGRWIEINLYEQTVSVYENNHLIFATLVSTGIDSWWTRPGLFQISEKVDSTPMSGAFEADLSDYYYLEDVPWTMYFDEKRALHGAYWHNQFGYQRSHGCANLSPGDAHWLYQWAQLGDYVYVWDPSGRTPTDPSLYTAGGA
jgi:hypothetical protein